MEEKNGKVEGWTPTPEVQDKMLKDIFSRLKEAGDEKHQEVVNKVAGVAGCRLRRSGLMRRPQLTPRERELYERFNNFQFEQERRKRESEAKKNGMCDGKDV